MISLISPMPEDNTCYVIVADGEFDQVCDTRRDCAREVDDLHMLGCNVDAIAWPARGVDALCDKLGSGIGLRRAMRETLAALREGV